MNRDNKDFDERDRHIEREEAALLILESLTEINDSVIFEAVNYRKRRNASLRGFVAVAAVFFLLIFSPMLDLISPQKGSDLKDPSSATLTLDSVLESALPLSKKAESDEDVFQSVTRLAFERVDDGSVYYLDISEKEEEKLRLLSSNKKQKTEASADFRIWIVSENGITVSVHLESSNGNIGYKELFDYSCEYVPSDDFVRCVERIVNDRQQKNK